MYTKYIFLYIFIYSKLKNTKNQDTRYLFIIDLLFFISWKLFINAFVKCSFFKKYIFAMSVRENIYILELIQSYKISHMVGGNRPCNASNDI